MRPPYWKLFLYPGKSVEIFPVFKSVFMMIVIYINSYRSAINLTNWWCHDNPLRMNLWLLYNDHVKSYIKMLKNQLTCVGFLFFSRFPNDTCITNQELLEIFTFGTKSVQTTQCVSYFATFKMFKMPQGVAATFTVSSACIR